MDAAVDQQLAVAGDSFCGQSHQALFHAVRQVSGLHVKPQLDRRRDLVDVLSTRPRGSDESFLNVSFEICHGHVGVRRVSDTHLTPSVHCMLTFAMTLMPVIVELRKSPGVRQVSDTHLTPSVHSMSTFAATRTPVIVELCESSGVRHPSDTPLDRAGDSMAGDEC